MTLQSIRFKSIEDIQQFITKFISMDFLDKQSKNKLIAKEIIVQGKKTRSFEGLYKNLLVSTDGSIYLLKDIKHHLAAASEKELQDSNIRFLTSDNQIITLSQLKKQSSLFDKMKPSFDTYLVLKRMNLNVFQSKPFPSLDSMKDINEAIIQYSTKDLHRFTNSLLTQIKLIQYNLNRTSLERFYKGFEYITTLHKDLLKLTVLEEDKLKRHLNQKLTTLSSEEEIAAVTDWIAVIDKNKEQTLKYFQELSNCLPDIQTFIVDKKLRHQRILNNDPTLENTKEKIKHLNAEKIQLADKVKNKEDNLVRSQTLAVGGILFAPAILLPIAALILVGTLAPAFLLIAAGITVLYGIALLITLTCFNDSYMQVINSIENLVNKPLDDLKEQLTGLNQKLEYAEEDVQFMQDYPEWNDKFIPHFGNPNLIMSELNSDIRELSQLRPSVELEKTPNNKPAESSASVRRIGMFGQKENDTSLETESPNLTVSP